jgi:hypothetical protein
MYWRLEIYVKVEFNELKEQREVLKVCCGRNIRDDGEEARRKSKKEARK